MATGGNTETGLSYNFCYVVKSTIFVIVGGEGVVTNAAATIRFQIVFFKLVKCVYKN